MKSLLNYIGIGIFVGWVIALIANFSIYEHTTSQATFLHPIIDAIIFMAIMLVIYFVIIRLYRKQERNASFALLTLGAVSVVFAVLLLSGNGH